VPGGGGLALQTTTISAPLGNRRRALANASS
jgi:hypothetical protein